MNSQTHKSEVFRAKAGTVLQMGDEKFTLTEDTDLPFDGAENETKLVGMLLHSKNLDTNRAGLRHKYNGFGMPLPVESQVSNPKDTDEVNSFIVSLSPSDAAMFDVTNRRNSLIEADEQLKKSELAKELKASAEAQKRDEEINAARAASREAEIQKQAQISLREIGLKTIEHNDQNPVLAATKEAEIKSDIAADVPKVERLTDESVRASDEAAKKREADAETPAKTAKKTTKSSKK